MGIDTEIGGVFMRRRGRVIRYLERHQDIPLDFWYLDTETDREFHVREFTDEMRGPVSMEDIRCGDRESHRKAIRHALDAGLPLKRPRQVAQPSNVAQVSNA